MFKAAEFSSSDDDDFNMPAPGEEPTAGKAAKTRRAASGVAPAAATFSSAAGPRAVVAGFHRPGDASFSAVAIPPAHLIERSANAAAAAAAAATTAGGGGAAFTGSDAHGVGSASWASAQCRCLRCELLHAAPAWAPSDAPRTLVLLDADNFAFPAFCRRPAPPELIAHLTHAATRGPVFVWAFYGACFSKHFKVDLGAFVATSKPPAQAPAGAPAIANSNAASPLAGTPSTWEALRDHGAVRCTRCAGSAQAADLVCEAVAAVVRDELHVRCVLLTGDRGLRDAVGEVWARRDPATYALPLCERSWSARDVWRAVLPAARVDEALSRVPDRGGRGRGRGHGRGVGAVPSGGRGDGGSGGAGRGGFGRGAGAPTQMAPMRRDRA